LMDTLQGDGFDIIGDSAIKELFKVHEIKSAILEKDLRPTIPGECPQEFSDIIQQCWLKDPSERPDDENLVQTLDLLLNSSSVLSPRSPSSLPSSPSPSIASSLKERTPSKKEELTPSELRSNLVFQSKHSKSKMSTSHLMAYENNGNCTIQSVTIDDLSLNLRPSARIFIRTKFRRNTFKSQSLQFGKLAGKAITFENINWVIPCTQSSWLTIDLVVKTGLTSRVEASVLVSVLFLSSAQKAETTDMTTETRKLLRVKNGKELADSQCGTATLTVNFAFEGNFKGTMPKSCENS